MENNYSLNFADLTQKNHVLKDKFNELLKNGLPSGLNIGLKVVDDLFRFDTKNLVVLTGIPGSGKSEFIDFLCVQYNKLHKLKTCFYSPENYQSEEHIYKLYKKFSKDTDTEADTDTKLNHILNNFFFQDYDEVYTIEQILEGFRQNIEINGTKVCIIDNYSKLEASQDGRQIETLIISKLLDKLERFAKKNDVLLILVTHPRKMLDKDGTVKMPKAYDIQGSAHFYNKADYCITIHRDNKKKTPTLLYAEKVRSTNYGKTGDIILDFDTQTMNYYYNPANYQFFGNTINTFEYQSDNDIPKNYPSIEYVAPFDIPLPIEYQFTDYLNIEVDLFPYLQAKTHTTINLKDFIRSTAYKDIANEIISNDNGPAKIKERKDTIVQNCFGTTLSCVAISARFASGHNSTDLLSYTGLIAIDIDYKDNKDIMDKVPEILKRIPNIAAFKKSITGLGYYAIVPTLYKDKVKEHFNSLYNDFKRLYGIVLDTNCSDYTRLRLGSFDIEYWINENYVELYRKTAKNLNKDKTKDKTDTDNNKIDVDRILSDCKKNNIDITKNYSHWNKIALALISIYKDNDKGKNYFHEFSKLNNKYNESESNEQYEKMLK